MDLGAAGQLQGCTCLPASRHRWAVRGQSVSLYKSLSSHNCLVRVQSDHYQRRLKSNKFPSMRKESIQPAQHLPYHLIAASP